MARNAHKSTFVRGSLPNIFEGEDRRFQQCEQPFIVLASVEDGSMYKNDVTHVFQNVVLGSDTVTITIEKNGVELTNRGTSVFYPNSPNAVGFIFDWRQYLQNEGAGCYTIKLACVLAGVQVDFTWGNYELSPWTIESAMNTVRVYSRFNSYALNHNIDFTGSNAVDSIRFEGFFGNMQPNTKVNNLRGNNNVQSKVTRENLKTYELTSDLLNVCHTKRLIDLHFLHENTVWISDHNPQNHSYDYRDIELIVKEVPEVDYKKDVRGAVVSCVFEDKKPYYKSRYRTSSPISDVTPAPICQDATVNVNKSNGDLIQSVTVASGGTEPYNVADSTAVLKDSAGNTLSTTSIKATETEDIPAPDTTLQVNGVTEGTHVAGSTIGISLSDGTNPVTPDSVTKVGNNYEVVVQGGGACPIGAKPIKTGQLTSYETGDDGETRRGRLVDFFTLSGNNAFGNPDRFTDLLGGQDYVIPVMLDHDTDDGSEILSYTYNASGTWSGVFAFAKDTLNTDSKTDWALINRQELERLINEDSERNLEWSPLSTIVSFVTGNTLWWTATTPKNNLARAKVFSNQTGTVGNEMITYSKALSGARSLAVRYYTYAELGL